MQAVVILLVAASLLFGVSAGSAQAVEYKAKGQYLMGFTLGQGGMLNKLRESSRAPQTQAKNDDKFEACQRIRLQVYASASENLSGSLVFEIGESTWGQADNGAALGADDKIVDIRHAYLDWALPDSNLKIRMGLQPVLLPNVAGGSAVLDDDLAGVVASYQFNEQVALTALWVRPWNDNHNDTFYGEKGTPHPNSLDNIDLFGLALPLTFEAIELSPWIAYGIVGRNATSLTGFWDGYYLHSFLSSGYADRERWNVQKINQIDDSYRSAFWAGLPISLSAFAPFNIEVDGNYGYVAGIGRGTLVRSDGVQKRFDTKAEGWLMKALVEYKMDWGTPGILGWYASGDDSNPSNGSERMPSISPFSTFSSTFGGGNLAWSTSDRFYERSVSYSGTWGIGLQIKDMRFVEKMSHTFRAVYRGGTNSPAMAKYANGPWSWGNLVEYKSVNNEPYLTTKDSLLECNLVNSWKLYENLELNLELGYVVNFIDHDTWKKSNASRKDRASFQKQDAWKAQLIFAYTF